MFVYSHLLTVVPTEKANPKINTKLQQSEYAQDSPLMGSARPTIKGRLTSMSTPRITLYEENIGMPEKKKMP